MVLVLWGTSSVGLSLNNPWVRCGKEQGREKWREREERGSRGRISRRQAATAADNFGERMLEENESTLNPILSRSEY